MINEVINMNILNELNEACDYIENNICKDIEIDELAKITNQSNDSINRFVGYKKLCKRNHSC